MLAIFCALCTKEVHSVFIWCCLQRVHKQLHNRITISTQCSLYCLYHILRQKCSATQVRTEKESVQERAIVDPVTGDLFLRGKLGDSRNFIIVQLFCDSILRSAGTGKIMLDATAGAEGE